MPLASVSNMSAHKRKGVMFRSPGHSSDRPVSGNTPEMPKIKVVGDLPPLSIPLVRLRRSGCVDAEARLGLS